MCCSVTDVIRASSPSPSPASESANDNACGCGSFGAASEAAVDRVEPLDQQRSEMLDGIDVRVKGLAFRPDAGADVRPRHGR